MNRIILIILCFAYTSIAYSQSNTCPTINGYGSTTVSSANGNCTNKIYAYITSTVGSAKSVRIQVYEGMGVTGALLVDNCFSVGPNAISAYFETELFTAPCLGVITYVISGYSSSNGNCNTGASCGTSVTVMAISAGPLPIKLSAFYAKRKNTAVTLTWQTESEINAKEFVLQVKGAKDYVDVVTIPASNKANGSSYAYSDQNNSKVVSEYRLKMIDLDGQFKYSEVRTVKGMSAENDFTVFPNPSTGNTKVTISDISEPTDVQLVDLSGRVIRSLSLNNSQGINLTNMQNGVYLVRIIRKNSGESLTKKITVVN
jgi:hypothetical protein